MIELYNIPVLSKTPVRGLAINELVVEAKLKNPVSMPNGAMIGFLGTYTPGGYTNLGEIVRLHDIVLEPSGTAIMSVWGGKTDPVYTVDVLSENLAYIPNIRRPWDFLVVFFDLRRPPEPPISLVDEMTGVRGAVIATNALIIE